MCGIIGILSTTKKDVGLYIYDALTIIQHRGQDAAGITTASKGRFYICLLYTSPSPRDRG